jgi:phosphate transport system substrate-binding protein
MKKITAIAFGLGVAFSLSSCKNSKDSDKAETSADKEVRISFSGAFALYPLAVKWGEEYTKLHPNVRFDIQAGGAGKGMTDALSGAVDVGMFSREISDEEKSKGVWWVALTKDAVIPTMNSENPLAATLRKTGLKKEGFQDIFINETAKSWEGLVPGTKEKAGKINVYTRSDACGAAGSWADFLGKKQENLKGVGVFGDPGVADAVIKDKNGIGYNNTNYVYDVTTGEKRPGIEPIPIDVNGNGTIDPEENFYESLSSVLQAVIDGKYPSPPARDLYFITKGKPQRPEILEFMKWVLTEGQKYVKESGYVPLPGERIQGELKKL